MSDNDVLEDLLEKKLNVWTEEPEQIQLNNPVLNAMFYGGLPRRSVIQIAAQSGTGKSTIVLQAAKELCERGHNVLYIDAEKGLSTKLMKSTGVYKYLNNKDKSIGGKFIITVECDCTEVNNAIQVAAQSGDIEFIILDSLGSLDSGIYDLGGTEANNPKVGADTKSIKVVMKTMNKVAIEHNIGFIFINHLQQTIGSFIQQEIPTGGRAPVYLSDVVIRLTKKAQLEIDKKPVGQKVEYEAVKSRWGNGKCKIPFYIWYGKGIAMIPTYCEVLCDKRTTYKGENKPVIEMRGGGNGSLYLRDKEYKFRGDTQLYNLVAQHYKEVEELISWEDFSVRPPELPDWGKFEQGVGISETIGEESDLPEELSTLDVVDVTTDMIYFKKGVDPTGQEYHLGYWKKLKALTVYFDGSDDNDCNITLDTYKKLEKKLEKYLKKCEKDML